MKHTSEERMSKLATLLRRLSHAEPAPMGFAAITGRAKNSEMLLAVQLEKADAGAAGAAVKAGAAFLLLNASLEKDSSKIQELTSAVDVPCGIFADTPSKETSERAKSAGLDFVVLPNDGAPAVLLLDEDNGYVMKVAEGASDTALRLMESLSIDALFGDAAPHPLTIGQQLELRRTSGLTRKPLILKFNDESGSDELECLRDSGVAALLIEGVNATERLTAARTTVDAIRPRRRRRNDRDSTPVLPSVGRGTEEDDEED
jgi:hypothetical protein